MGPQPFAVGIAYAADWYVESMGRVAARHLPDEKWVMADRTGELHVVVNDVDGARVLTVDGVLDATTYVPLRDSIVSAALEEPHVVVVDITGLSVREDPAWAVFTSARWQIAEWPDVPIGVVSLHEQDRNSLHRNGITRYVPTYATLASAVAELSAVGQRRYRRRACASVPATPSSIRRCRELTATWLAEWSRTDFTHVASLVAAELVEAALAVTDAAFALRLETDGSTVSVVVQHVGIANPVARKSPRDNVSGLDLVAANSRAWGAHTTLAGNTVWAVVGPENRF